METLLKQATGAPGDYIASSIPFTESRNAQTEYVEKLTLPLTPAEYPGDEMERMTFIHQYPSFALEDELDDEDEDIEDDLDDDDIDDIELDDEDLDEDDEDLDDEDLDLDIDEDDEEDEEDII